MGTYSEKKLICTNGKNIEIETNIFTLFTKKLKVFTQKDFPLSISLLISPFRNIKQASVKLALLNADESYK